VGVAVQVAVACGCSTKKSCRSCLVPAAHTVLNAYAAQALAALDAVNAHAAATEWYDRENVPLVGEEG